MTLWFFTTLSLFMAAIAFLALYGLTVSAHFPFEIRAAELQTGIGALTMWTTVVTSAVAAVIVGGVAPRVLPWTSIIIGGGVVLLAAPLLVRAFPDRFVDRLAGVITFAVGAMLTALMLWFAAL